MADNVTGETLTTVAWALKYQYLPDVQSQVAERVPLLHCLMQTPIKVAGDAVPPNTPVIRQLPKSLYTGGISATFFARMSDEEGINSAGENEIVPWPSSSTGAKGEITCKKIMGKIAFTNEALVHAANTKFAAFANLMDDKVETMVSGIARDMNRQLNGDGGASLCALTADVTDSTSMTITVDDVSKLARGMLVDVVSVSGSTYTRKTSTTLAIKVGAIDAANLQFTGTKYGTDTSDTIFGSNEGDGWYLYRWGNAGSLSGDTFAYREINGVDGLVGTGACGHATTCLGINPSTYNEWQSTVDTNSSVDRDFDETILQELYDDVCQYGSPNLWLTTPAQRRNYIAALQPQVRYAPRMLLGGFQVLSWSGGGREIPILIDAQAVDNQWTLLDTKKLFFALIGDFTWEPGSIKDILHTTLVGTSGTHGYEALTYRYWNLGTFKRRSHGKANHINDPS